MYSRGFWCADGHHEAFPRHRGLAPFGGLYFGGVVGSHWAISSNAHITKSAMYTLFYGIYGALLFPFAILWGIYMPPMWRAAFMPLYIRAESPGWTNVVPISFVLDFFKYDIAEENDTTVDKVFLRVMCGITAAFCGISLFIKSK